MARITKLALFWRAFLVTLIAGAPMNGNRAEANEAGDWARATSEGTKDAYIRYLRRNPAGQHIEDAINKLIGLGAVAPGAPRTRDVQLY